MSSLLAHRSCSGGAGGACSCTGSAGSAGGAAAAALAAQAITALASGGGTALPTALRPAREPTGSFQSVGKPMSAADSTTVRQRTVAPARVHQMRGWDAVTAKAGCCTERMHGVPLRLVVLLLTWSAGSGSPAAARASATLTRTTGSSFNALITAGVDAIKRTRLDPTP
eukprot:scaffold11381_cov68-Phaeocystis_antarctica.AAC.8